MHESVFHVLAESGDELKSLLKKQRRGERSGNRASISKQLAPQAFDQSGNRLAIIDVAWSQTTGQQFALVVDRQMQNLKP